MYDLLIVGAGLTAATLAAVLKGRMRIGVLDCRAHLGGNCFDEVMATNDERQKTKDERASVGTPASLVHRYGPHIFHSPNPRIVEFLSRYTEWVAYEHRVVAEVEWGDETERTKDDRLKAGLRTVPFPYCWETVRALGRELSEEEVLEMFFHGYSRKMWGMGWEDLPASVRGRVPRELTDRPMYYREQFVALPRLGYTRMMENMLDGVEVRLGVGPREWLEMRAREVVYTGRADLIPLPGGPPEGATGNLKLEYRTLDIAFGREAWGHDAVCVHACTAGRPWTRKTNYSRMMGRFQDERQKTKDERVPVGTRLVSTETPRAAGAEELTPYYPVELAENRRKYEALAGLIREAYPHLHLAGRLGSYRYFDMYQAVGQALMLAEKLTASQVMERSLQYA